MGAGNDFDNCLHCMVVMENRGGSVDMLGVVGIE